MRTFWILTAALLAGPALAQSGGTGVRLGGGADTGGGAVEFETGGGAESGSGVTRADGGADPDGVSRTDGVADPDGDAASGDGALDSIADPGVITDISELPPGAGLDDEMDRAPDGGGVAIGDRITDPGVITDISELPAGTGEDAGSGTLTGVSEPPHERTSDGLTGTGGFGNREGFSGVVPVPRPEAPDSAAGLEDDEGLSTGIGGPAGGLDEGIATETDGRPRTLNGDPLGGARSADEGVGGDVEPKWVRPDDGME